MACLTGTLLGCGAEDASEEPLEAATRTPAELDAARAVLDASRPPVARVPPDASPYAFLSRILDSEEVPVAWEGLPYLRIAMERSGCHGDCPAYSVELLRGSGESTRAVALYEGRQYAEREGRYQGAVDLWSYARLCQLIEHLGFQDLAPEYAANWTDDFTVVIRTEELDGSHAVSDYGQQAPPDFFAVRMAIDAIAAQIDWQPE